MRLTDILTIIDIIEDNSAHKYWAGNDIDINNGFIDEDLRVGTPKASPGPTATGPEPPGAAPEAATSPATHV